MNTTAVIQIITAALQLAPLAVGTIASIKQTLALDPAVPENLRNILQATADNNAATLSMIQEWMDKNPV